MALTAITSCVTCLFTWSLDIFSNPPFLTHHSALSSFLHGTPQHTIQDVFVPQQDLVDSYLPSFQTCVEEGKVSGIMWGVTCCSTKTVLNSAFFILTQHYLTPPLPPSFSLRSSYNAVNGVPSCANDWLLNDVLRGAWEFDGCV